MLSIKPATYSDIPLIISLANQVWPQTYVPILGPDQVTFMLGAFYSIDSLQQQMDTGHHFAICNLQGEPVAFASWSAMQGGGFKLHKLYIQPGNQGRGVGKLVLEYIFGTIKEQNGNTLFLNVNRYNHKAIAFYEKIGFVLAGEEDIDIGNGYFMNDYVYRFDLK